MSAISRKIQCSTFRRAKRYIPAKNNPVVKKYIRPLNIEFIKQKIHKDNKHKRKNNNKYLNIIVLVP